MKLTCTVPTVSRWGPKQLSARKALVGDRAFARGFRQKAIAQGELTFPSWSQAVSAGRTIMVKDFYSPGSAPTFAGVDLSSEGRPGTVIFIVAVLPSGFRMPVEIKMGRWTSPETARQIENLYLRHRWQTVTVENNGYQQALIDWAKESRPAMSFWPTIQAFHTGKQKADEQLGLPGLEVELKNEAWQIPAGEWAGHDEGCTCAWCWWNREMVEHPAHATTDTVMAMWFAREAIRKGVRGPLDSYPYTLQIGR